MANAGPNINGSQFFFTWKDTTLTPGSTPFGTVISGANPRYQRRRAKSRHRQPALIHRAADSHRPVGA